MRFATGTNYVGSTASDLLFSVDSLKCDRCGAKMRILCPIHSPESIKKILDCLGIPAQPPPAFARASAGKQFSLQYWKAIRKIISINKFRPQVALKRSPACFCFLPGSFLHKIDYIQV
jgi:hypothetical protein